MQRLEIEIVAYRLGLGMLTKKNPNSKRITSLTMSDITFSACMNTMAIVKKKTGHNAILTDGVGKVQAGVARIIELQEEGYSYIRP